MKISMYLLAIWGAGRQDKALRPSDGDVEASKAIAAAGGGQTPTNLATRGTARGSRDSSSFRETDL